MDKGKIAQILNQNPGLLDAINDVASESHLVGYLGDSMFVRGSRNVVDLNQKGQYIAFFREDHRWRVDGKGGTEWTMVFGLYDSASGAVICSESSVVRDWQNSKRDRRGQWWDTIAIDFVGERVKKRVDCGAWHLGTTPYEEEVKETVAILLLKSATQINKVVFHLHDPVQLSCRRLTWEEYREMKKRD